MLLLRSYSHHSLLSALPKTHQLLNNAKEKGYSLVGLTDENTISGLVEFFDYANEQDIKPALGVTLSTPFLVGTNLSGQVDFGKIGLVAKSKTGYVQILELTTKARTERDTPIYHILLEDLRNKDILVILGGNEHEVIQLMRMDQDSRAFEVLEKYRAILGDNLVVEMAIPFVKDEPETIRNLNLKLYNKCQELGIKAIVSPAPRYLEKTSEKTYKAILAISSGQLLKDIHLEREFDLPTVAELKQDFDYLPLDIWDTTELENSITTELRTDFASKASEAFFPPVELEMGQTYDNLLIWESYLGLMEKFEPSQKNRKQWKEIYGWQDFEKLRQDAKNIVVDSSQMSGYPESYWQKATIDDYIIQLEKELGIIFGKGYSSYFLVVSDLAFYCRNEGIVASARGSGAGSLIGFLNDISTLDTLYYQIPFERFLNPLRPSAPDVDLDVADDKRGQVINYLVTKYGSDRVSQVITFGTMLPKNCIRDIGRVLGISYSKCDKISKLVPMPPFGKKPSFKYAFELSEEFVMAYENDEDTKIMVDLGRELEGNYRHASIHAAAVLVTPTKLTDYAAVQWDSDKQMKVCQYDWHDAEKIGILPCKMDILGVTIFSIIGNSIDLIKERRGVEIDLRRLDLWDEKVYKMLTNGLTFGVFQLSGGAMTKYLQQLKPTRIQDLQAMVALYRPGAMAQIPEFIRRRNNAKLVKYYVPQMVEWMEDTYGILVYQEDIMFTFMKLADYSFGQADNVRRALGKKNKQVLDKEFVGFLSGCENNQISKEKVQELWDLIVPFSDYSFNKAHSGAYGMVAYWTAYIKANFTAEYMASLMLAESGDAEKVALSVLECQKMNIQVLPPDINMSSNGFNIENDQTIRYGMKSIKNLSANTIEYLVTNRNKNGNYKDFEDFLDRICTQDGFNKRSLEALILSGSLDNLKT